MTPTRKRRLVAVSLILVAVGIAATLTIFALQQNMTYLFSPSEIAAGKAPAASFRLGGVVLEKSLQRSPNSLKVDFVVTDRFHDMPVEYTGILPDLFKEGKGVVAQGKLGADGVFAASEVLAKHDENYMPPEAADAVERANKAMHESQKTLVKP